LRTDTDDGQRAPLVASIQARDFNPFIGVGAPLQGTATIYRTDPVTGLSVPIGTQSYDNRAAALAASYIGHSEFYERDFLYDAKINAHLFPNLWDGGWDFAAGYEHRNVHQHSVPDPVQAAGDQLGFNQSPNFKQTQEVDSFFTELSVPIVTSTMNVPFVRSLDFSIAWRYEKFKDRDDYLKLHSSFDNANENENFGGTPRVSIRYQPIPDLTLRASWGQSFLSPNPQLLFTPVFEGFPVVFDPTKGNTLQPPDGTWEASNTALKPEKTDSYSAGLVYTPKWLPGFTMTMDWYQIYTKDLILTAADNAQVLLSLGIVDPDGFGNGSGAAVAPGGTGLGITRFDTGALEAIDSQATNAGKRLVQGLDVTAVYELPTERWGKFTFSGGWNHFFTWKAEAADGLGGIDFLGNYNNGTLPLAPGGIPFNKGFLRGEWEWRHFDFVATANYVGDYNDDPSFINQEDGVPQDLVPGNPGTAVQPNFIFSRRVTSYITLDMQLSYEFVKPVVEPAPYVKESKDSKNVMQTEAATSSIWQRMLWGTRLTVGVNDAFDRQPPSVLAAFNDNYDTSNYSIRNRYWYVSLNKKF
jgi:iron complex outermembrane receptor protein